MISGLYSAATAMQVADMRHVATAENLANVQVPGFRRRIIPQSSFDTMLQMNSQRDLLKSVNLGTVARPVEYSFEFGHLSQTDRPMDVAIEGDGFFTVDGPFGPLYTRNGSFHVTPDRELVTIDRLPVMGVAGPIVLPADANTERVRITSDGRLMADGVEFGQFNLVRFDNVDQLTSRGASLFEAPPTAGQQPSTATLLQGSLELSNASTVEEMVNMIATTRQYEAAQRAMNSIAEAIQKRIGLR
ncbi:MAG: flagellar hook basal-body protein [Planctomycetaceae bacterium]|nr:flagellar hook basal-body protein [Planctomycetaceae bacterium]